MLDEYTEEFGTGLSNPLDNISAEDPTPFQPTRNPINRPRPAQVRSQPVFQDEIPVPQQAPQRSMFGRQRPAQQAPQQQYAPQPQQQPQPIYQQYIYPNAPEPQPQPAPYNPQPQQPYYPPVQQQMPAGPRDRISNIFNEESKELNELLRAEEGGCLKNIIFMFTCLLIVAVSFWASYAIGTKVFMPEGHRAPNILPDFGQGKKILGQFKDKVLFSNDLVKTEDDFKKPEIQLNPGTPILPPEVQQLPPETKPMQVQKAVVPKPAAKPKRAIVSTPGNAMYRVIVGSFDNKEQAQDVISNIRSDGFPVFMYKIDGKYRLQIGAFSNKATAVALMKKANEYGYNAFLSIK